MISNIVSSILNPTATAANAEKAAQLQTERDADRPVISTALAAKAVATAASIALPPSRRIRAPASAASRWVETTIPPVPTEGAPAAAKAEDDATRTRKELTRASAS